MLAAMAIVYPINTSAIVTCTESPAGIIGWWPGDGNAIDIQGPHSGTLFNGVAFVPGEVDYAFSFNGSNSYVDIGDVDLPGAFTIDAWINPASVSNSPIVLSKDDGNNQRSYFLRVDSTGSLTLLVRNNGGNVTRYATGSSVVTAGTWQHVAATYDGSAGPGNRILFYVNGVAKPASVVNGLDSGGVPENNSLPAKIGINGDGISNPFNGWIDEVQVFASALSLSQVQSIFNAGASGNCKRMFQIFQLTPNNLSAIDPTNGTNFVDDHGGIAVSTSKAFLSGDGDTGVWDRGDLGNPGNVGAVRDGIVSNLRTDTVYALADALGNPISSPGGTVAKLVQLDPGTGAPTLNSVALSQPISVNATDTQVGIFSGYDRVVLVDGVSAARTAYNIDLPSGLVTPLGTVTAPEYANRPFAETWATWGVAEFFAGAVNLAYVADTNRILRTNVITNSSSVIADFSPYNLADAHEFTFVPSMHRWYFHYEGGDTGSIAGVQSETLAFADAGYVVSGSRLPTLANIPAGIIAEATGPGGATVSFSPTATDQNGNSLTVNSVPASGSTFPLGVTTVTCTATDVDGNTSSASFNVTVRDTTPPSLVVPLAITVKGSKQRGGKIVTFDVTATDLVDGAITPVVTPPSGTFFKYGKTTVKITAVDAHRNRVNSSFTVTVTKH